MNGNFTIIYNDFIDELIELSGAAVKIYMLLRRMVNPEKNGDVVYPSYSYITKVLGLSPESISKGIKELQESGWITVEKVKSKNNQYSRNIYHVTTTKNEVVDNEPLRKPKRTTTETEVTPLRKPKLNNTNITRLINNPTGDFENSKTEKPKTEHDKVKLYFEDELHMKMQGKKWEEFIGFAVDRKQNHAEDPASFVAWLNNQPDGFNPRYWSPDRMMTCYPQAYAGFHAPSEEEFIHRNPNRVAINDDDCVPPPDMYEGRDIF